MANVSTILDIEGTGWLLIAICPWLNLLKEAWLQLNTCKYDGDCSGRLREDKEGQYVSDRVIVGSSDHVVTNPLGMSKVTHTRWFW